MHFYKSAATLDMQSCLSIFDATADVLARLRDIDKNNDLHRVCTRYITTTTILSVASIARVLKGPFASYLDQIRGYELFEFGVRFLRSCSVEKGDFGERAAAFSERIWQSKKVFRDPDGSINITLRVRNRLSAGPLHDVIRCWKDEFVDLEYRYSHVPGMDIGTFFLPVHNIFLPHGKCICADTVE
jgi:transcriptional regulatory protein LEU3